MNLFEDRARFLGVTYRRKELRAREEGEGTFEGGSAGVGKNKCSIAVQGGSIEAACLGREFTEDAVCSDQRERLAGIGRMGEGAFRVGVGPFRIT